MAKTYFISDLHFGHKNILAFDNRPFATVEEHDLELIRRWNSTVNMDDDVWVLGDISWYNATRTIDIYNQLNGVKHLVRGNHDKKLLRNRDIQGLFAEIYDYKELDIGNGRFAVLCHYPIPCFNGHFYDAVHFYGHVHSSFEWDMTEHFRREMEDTHGKHCNMINIGCMLPYMDYTPRTLDDIVSRYQSWRDTCADSHGN